MSPSDTTTTTTTPSSGRGSPIPNLARFGCARCRQHHLKCDRVTPVCGRCRTADEPCLPPGLKIRETNKYKFKFAKKQRWIKTPRRLVFIDESQTIINDVSSPDSGPDDFDAAWDSPPVTEVECHSNTSPMPPYRPPSPPDRSRLMAISSVVDPPPPIWPLTNPEEAALFRHFMDKLATWLDLCDPYHTFQNIVPHRSRDCQVLLRSIFALSARHLGQTHHDISQRKRYNQLADMHNAACINIMQCLLTSKNYKSMWTEHLFAATIILQVMEEMNAALRDDADTDVDDTHEALKRGHLPGMYRFVGVQSFGPGTLGAASFWVGLRQEIYIAVTKRQPVCLYLVHPGLVDRSLDEPPEDDFAWANAAVVHCADVVNFWLAPEKQEPHAWDELSSWNRRWAEKLPPSYDPFFTEPPGASVFPGIWYHQGCQGKWDLVFFIGVQHHRLARLFLLDHRLRPGNLMKAKERASVEERIRKTVREICAIGRGNQFTPPGIFTACMAISAFGHYFDKVEEQDAMLEILDQTQRDYARPTGCVRREMLQAWGRHAAVPKPLVHMNGNGAQTSQ
ncbi:hypothetical protein B0I37DRAFT_310474 [Chaetomium sp. MPI-CAGE-AT-0009]|nr:hypothetical protein B0I37DRAFT_310474 [Chaetomium sp. MPI-CAGE-AT-0009]